MIKVSLSKDQVELLKVCAQLLELGQFSLPGKELYVAVSAKQMLSSLIQEAEAPPSLDVAPAPVK
jgi:hypothetical protein